jgi:hypothetical protein
MSRFLIHGGSLDLSGGPETFPVRGSGCSRLLFSFQRSLRPGPKAPLVEEATFNFGRTYRECLESRPRRHLLRFRLPETF